MMLMPSPRSSRWPSGLPNSTLPWVSTPIAVALGQHRAQVPGGAGHRAARADRADQAVDLAERLDHLLGDLGVGRAGCPGWSTARGRSCWRARPGSRAAGAAGRPGSRRAPVPASAETRSTTAPRSVSRRYSRSSITGSLTRISSRSRCTACIASASPKVPEVVSAITVPGSSCPSASAFRRMYRAGIIFIKVNAAAYRLGVSRTRRGLWYASVASLNPALTPGRWSITRSPSSCCATGSAAGSPSRARSAR